ncbi:hypothetical protein J3U08_11530, partial [Gilliamella sp. B2894]
MGKSSGKSKSPYEAPDNLQSNQELRIIDMLGEGQIRGIVGGLKGVFLNDTPVQTPEGNFNFKGVEIDWVNGTQS